MSHGTYSLKHNHNLCTFDTLTFTGISTTVMFVMSFWRVERESIKSGVYCSYVESTFINLVDSGLEVDNRE